MSAFDKPAWERLKLVKPKVVMKPVQPTLFCVSIRLDNWYELGQNSSAFFISEEKFLLKWKRKFGK